MPIRHGKLVLKFDFFASGGGGAVVVGGAAAIELRLAIYKACIWAEYI